MKRVLSFLLMIVFLQAQVSTAFAKRGGPDIVGTQNVDTIGTFAGVLIPTSTTSATGSSANSIGLFSLGVPDAGVATGSMVMFDQGISFNGTITGVADPLNGKLTGIIDAISTASFFDEANPDVDFRAFAQGNLEAQIKETASFNAFSSSVSFFSFATTRLEGLASVDINGGPNEPSTATYIVDGFKQSSSVVQADVALEEQN